MITQSTAFQMVMHTKGKQMHFEKIEIENFRGVGKLVTTFDPRLTVFIGNNGAGKTSILDCLAHYSLRTLNYIQSGKGFSFSTIPGEDVKSGSEVSKIRSDISLFDKMGELKSLEIIAESSDAKLSRAQVKNAESWKADLNHTHLFVYYVQGRGAMPRNSSAWNLNGERDADTFVLNNESLSSDLQPLVGLQNWWNDRDAQEARSVRDENPKYRDPQLQAIRQIVTKIDGFLSIGYDSTKTVKGIYFKKTDGSAVHISKLSSGQLAYIILLADLARRLQIIAPDKNLEDIPGIVLIDEIELNLHPRWQSAIIPTLRRVFASCQFIITTHSPAVLSSVEAKHVRILKAHDSGLIEVSSASETMGRSANYLSEAVFGASERFPEVDAMINDFNDAYDNKDIEQARDLFASIDSAIEGHTPKKLILQKRLNKLEEAQ